MQFSLNKIRELSYLTFFSVFSFVFLLVFWYLDFYAKDVVGVFFNQLPIFLYYIMFVLLFSATGLFLYKNDKLKFIFAFSLFAFFLLASLFVTTGGGWHFVRTLFFSTFYLVMTSGGLLGGVVFLALFLMVFVFQFFVLISFLKERFNWSRKIPSFVSRFSFFERNLFHQFVPLVAFFSYAFNFERSFEKSKNFFNFLANSDLSFYLPLIEKIKTIFLNALPLLLGFFVLISIFVKNKKIYFILNVILLTLLLTPYLYVWIFLK